jgi:hypothetical protein
MPENVDALLGREKESKTEASKRTEADEQGKQPKRQTQREQEKGASSLRIRTKTAKCEAFRA